MIKIDIVGGVYGEHCAFPRRNQTFGSGGRAAAALSGHVDDVCLHTFLAESERRLVELNLGTFGVALEAKTRKEEIHFEYLHSLAVPKITPHPVRIQQEAEFSVRSDLVIQYGMMECRPKVEAEVCVYDPQSAFDPQNFSVSGSIAGRLAIVVNAGEAKKMTGEATVDAAAAALLSLEGTDAVVIKNGLHGVSAFSKEGRCSSPAYITQNVFTIGSGDVFVAAFTLAWAAKGRPLDVAIDFASRATAEYVNSTELPILGFEDPKLAQRKPAVPAGGNIYLAGPFREVGQRALIDDAREQLAALGMNVFSPIHDIGPGPAELVVKPDLRALEECDAVFAILNGISPGTVFEVGYARAHGKPVFCVTQNLRPDDLKLPIGTGCHTHEDYVSALHQIAWRDV